MARTKDFAAVIRAKLAADPDLADAVEDEAFNAYIAASVYEARVEAGMTQKRLADLIGTQQSVISRIEDADYDGHSIGLLKRIAKALGKKLRVEFYSGPSLLNTVQLETFSVDWEPLEAEWKPDFGTLEKTILASLESGRAGTETDPSRIGMSGFVAGMLAQQ